ncbi:hypothetical protein [Mucilaginibacter psychrotolerans]|uniref:DUF4350 domain-containing protein n=1 Tax=Mucilaginibacter psychrotolerans TaxID=1524096 RepID=A0A4Y8S2H2_9SPHI|nr:hypothetical protein [Mucilaginibacter psychrotolerans]TFF33243.1 hypothetical protein E2R66_26875 [Mucilaginibacter psychrotolerans]
MKKAIVVCCAFVLLGCLAKAQVTVTLDYYFNHETHKNAAGQPERFHYLWEDKSQTGFSILGDEFIKQGMGLKSLEEAPTLANLRSSNIYIIVDPDSKKENAAPNYMSASDVVAISTWVKKGGVLLMLANDSANVELPHFNTLAAQFGMHFNDDIQNHVIDDAHFEDGAVITAGNPVFSTAKKVFLKDVCSIGLSGKATPVLTNKAGAVIIAKTQYGKGFVLAVGDPWLYNEYVNGRLPAGFGNDKAAADIVAYLIKQVKR